MAVSPFSDSLTAGRLVQVTHAPHGDSCAFGMDAAIQFIAAFPDAHAWHVTLLTPDKRCIVNKPAIPTEELRKALPAWLQLAHTHVFLRPLLSHLVFLDLDAYRGSWATLVELAPRILSETSSGNYQFWGTLSNDMPAKHAVTMTKNLQVALAADPHSTGAQQQGRLPGSVNAKAGKHSTVRILHQSVQDMCQEALLRVIPRTTLQVEAR